MRKIAGNFPENVHGKFPEQYGYKLNKKIHAYMNIKANNKLTCVLN